RVRNSGRSRSALTLLYQPLSKRPKRAFAQSAAQSGRYPVCKRGWNFADRWHGIVGCEVRECKRHSIRLQVVAQAQRAACHLLPRRKHVTAPMHPGDARSRTARCDFITERLSERKIWEIDARK